VKERRAKRAKVSQREVMETRRGDTRSSDTKDTEDAKNATRTLDNNGSIRRSPILSNSTTHSHAAGH
jgi:hypothetical protein